MSDWSWQPHFLRGHFKFFGAHKDPVVHTFKLIVKYKDGSRETDDSHLSGFRKKKNVRRAAKKAAKRREQNDPQIEDVSYKLQNVYIQDWI
jgi:hypothetical protein